MAKLPPIGVRLEDDEADALRRAAESDDRSQSAMIRKIISDWLKKHGWLKSPAQPKRTPAKRKAK